MNIGAIRPSIRANVSFGGNSSEPKQMDVFDKDTAVSTMKATGIPVNSSTLRAYALAAALTFSTLGAGCGDIKWASHMLSDDEFSARAEESIQKDMKKGDFTRDQVLGQRYDLSLWKVEELDKAVKIGDMSYRKDIKHLFQPVDFSTEMRYVDAIKTLKSRLVDLYVDQNKGRKPYLRDGDSVANHCRVLLDQIPKTQSSNRALKNIAKQFLSVVDFNQECPERRNQRDDMNRKFRNGITNNVYDPGTLIRHTLNLMEQKMDYAEICQLPIDDPMPPTVMDSKGGGGNKGSAGNSTGKGPSGPSGGNSAPSPSPPGSSSPSAPGSGGPSGPGAGGPGSGK